MIKVAGVRFQQDGKMFYYDVAQTEPQVGDYVIAQTERGQELGEVILGVTEMEEDSIRGTLPSILRIATNQDIQTASNNRAREREAYVVCQQKIAEHQLEMKLVSVETSVDNSKMLFYFTANGRVDFRALVRDLASHFRTRIELRQIGVRDEARMLGGLGPCGRPICCGAFLNDFQPVSIRMAKDQNLSLNPTKISGVCGRLMCCLKYEQDQYEQTRKRMPRVGREVITPDGNGTVTDLNIVRETVSVRISTGDTAEIRVYPLEKITRVEKGQPARRPAAEEAPQEPLEETSDGETETLSAEEEALLREDPALREESATEEPRPQSIQPPRAEKRRGTPRFGPGSEKPQGEDKGDRPGGRNGSGSNRNKKQNGAQPGGKPEQGERSTRPDRPGKQARETKLGQPVRRENPDRKPQTAAPEAKEAGEEAVRENGGKKNPSSRRGQRNESKAPDRQAQPQAQEAQPQAREAAQSRHAKKSSGWADALEKAMEAAESN